MALTKVSTDGVKDDAITKTKIPANQIEASELADNAVDTNAIADQAVALSKLPHGTSSNDGKFLRANNGADPSFETVTSTTINNNADNRVITGSGTANTLNGESSVVIDANGKLGVGITSPSHKLHVVSNGTDTAFFKGRIIRFDGAAASDSPRLNLSLDGTDKTSILLNRTDSSLAIETLTAAPIIFDTNSTERMRIDSSGRVLLGTTTEGFGTADDLTIASSTDTGITIRSGTSNQGNIFFSDGTSGTDEFRGIIQYTHGSGTGEHLRFFVQSAEKVRLDSDGLKLNGDTAAANALDDYEEGTWTPSVHNGGGSIGNIYNAKYTKIGRLVHVQTYFHYNAGSSTSAFKLGGLPFTVGSDCYTPQVVDFQRGAKKGAYSRTHTNNTYLEFLYSSEATGSDRITLKGNQIGSGYIILATTYMV